MKRFITVISAIMASILITSLNDAATVTADTKENTTAQSNLLSTDTSDSEVMLFDSTAINLITSVSNNEKIKKIILGMNISSVLIEDYYETDAALIQDYSSMTPNCPNLESIEVDTKNTYYQSVDGILYTKDMKTLVYCPPGKKGALDIPEGVERIGFMAFQECSKLTSITFPSTLKTTGEASFGSNLSLKTLSIDQSNKYFKVNSNVLFKYYGEELVVYPSGISNKSYVIPEGVKEISDAAFMGCSNLVELVTNDNLTTVGIEAFHNCTNLRKVHFGNGLHGLYAGAFLNCSSLKELNLPEGTYFLGEGVLEGCDKLLEISIPSSMKDLNYSNLANVPNRVIKLYSPYIGFYYDIADGVTFYVYKNSIAAQRYKAMGVKMKYFDKNYVEVMKLSTAPDKAVKGSGKADTSWYDSSKNKFSISNPDQLAGLSRLVNKGTDFTGKTIELSKDLDLSCYKNWIPIGKETSTQRYEFKGNFNGCGYKIYNLRINRLNSSFQGLFGISSGDLKNIVINDAQVIGVDYTGILAGSCTGTITSCVVNGEIYGSENVGGLTGHSNAIVSNCAINASVHGISNVGGMIGWNWGNIMNCTNEGSVTGYSCVGGFAGYSNSGKITNCENRMTVSGDESVGGILGRISWETEVSSCTNSGNILGKESIGGIIGNYAFEGKVNDCTNEGNIIGVYYVGGIAGYLAVGTMNDCINFGEVKGNYGVGGVLGNLNFVYPDYERVIDCTNEGTYTGIAYAGDIIGRDFNAMGLS